jgi:hypothetical protein
VDALVPLVIHVVMAERTQFGSDVVQAIFARNPIDLHVALRMARKAARKQTTRSGCDRCMAGRLFHHVLPGPIRLLDRSTRVTCKLRPTTRQRINRAGYSTSMNLDREDPTHIALIELAFAAAQLVEDLHDYQHFLGGRSDWPFSINAIEQHYQQVTSAWENFRAASSTSQNGPQNDPIEAPETPRLPDSTA